MVEFRRKEDHINVIDDLYIKMVNYLNEGNSIKKICKKFEPTRDVEEANAFIDLLKINLNITDINPTSLFNAGLLEVEADRLFYYYNSHKLYLEIVELIREGVSYKDLIKINPNDYHLSAEDLNNTVLNAINQEFALQTVENHLNFFPSLRMVSKEINAPYSQVMKAFKIGNPQ